MIERKDICVIIPAYNEGKIIDSLLNKLCFFDGLIVVVNDGSKDDTKEKVETIMKSNKNICLLNHVVNIGPFSAIHTGIQFGIKSGCKFFAVIDGDGQHPPEFLEQILNPVLEDEADLVIGSRFLKSTNYKTNFIRSFGIKGSSRAISIFGGTKITDVNSGYRAFNIKCAKRMLAFYQTVNTVFEFTLRFCREGYRVKEISIPMNQRLYGISFLTKSKLFVYPFRIIFEIIKSFL